MFSKSSYIKYIDRAYRASLMRLLLSLLLLVSSPIWMLLVFFSLLLLYRKIYFNLTRKINASFHKHMDALNSIMTAMRNHIVPLRIVLIKIHVYCNEMIQKFFTHTDWTIYLWPYTITTRLMGEARIGRSRCSLVVGCLIKIIFSSSLSLSLSVSLSSYSTLCLSVWISYFSVIWYVWRKLNVSVVKSHKLIFKSKFLRIIYTCLITQLYEFCFEEKKEAN